MSGGQNRRLASARRVARAGAVAVIAASALLAASAWSGWVLYITYVCFALALGATAVITLVWMLHAWRTPDSLTESGLADSGLDPAHSFSLIVPARHEELVLEQTLDRIANSDHPAFEVLVVVGTDDHATRAVADRMASRYPDVIHVMADTSWPKNKPKALNTALRQCSGTITGVFDAEDDVHPALLRRVDQCFQRSGADMVQAGVQLMNFHSRWWTVHNVLEYYFWFRSRLHAHARQRFIPLGGNTVFIRTPMLQAAGGWDPECLAEDCELGVRLSSQGARTTVFYEPELVTREECPPTLRALIRQRTRWNQGYLQTLTRGCWRRLPLRQRTLCACILALPYALALAWLMIPVALVTTVLLKAPIEITLLSFLPLVATVFVLTAEAVGLSEFGRTFDLRPRLSDYARLIIGLVPYQAVLAYSAAQAVVRQLRGDFSWQKTTHLGLHLTRTENAVATATSAATPLPKLLDAITLGQAQAVSLTDAAAPPARMHSLPARNGDVADIHADRPTMPAALVSSADAPSLARRDAIASHTIPPRPADPLEPAGPLEPLEATRRIEPLEPTGPPESLSPTRPDEQLEPAGAGGRRDLNRLTAAGVWLITLIRSHADAAVQLPLLVAVGLVNATNAFHWPAVLFDEGTYIGNAWAVGSRGELAFYTYTYGHPPLGWLLISLWSSVGGLFGPVVYSLNSGRALMFVVTILSCSLLYTLARRLDIGRLFAVLAVLLFALSPLSLYFHRGTLLDNVATCWALAAFVLALSPRRRLWSFAGSGACFAASVLSKETALVVLPALILAAVWNTDPRTRRYCLTLLIAIFALIGALYPLYATLKGELIPGHGHVSLLGTDVNMVATRQGTGSVFDPHSVARGIVTFWLSLDPWLVAAALALSPLGLIRRGTRVAVVAFVIQAAWIARPGYLPAMYVIALLPFAALIVAGVADGLWRFVVNRRRVVRPAVGERSRPVTGLYVAGTRLPVAAFVSALALAAIAAVAGADVVPRWTSADTAATTVRLDTPTLRAQQWLLRHVGREQRIIATDDFWVYLVGHGYDSHPVRGGFNSPTIVSYSPLDKDPAVRRYFPYSWREFDFIVSTPAMREDTSGGTPNTAEALQNSRIVAAFGQGADTQIQIRAIMPTPLGTPAGHPFATMTYRLPGTGMTPSLDQVAKALRVPAADIVRQTGVRADPPAWWFYLGRGNYHSPLPAGITLFAGPA